MEIYSCSKLVPTASNARRLSQSGRFEKLLSGMGLISDTSVRKLIHLSVKFRHLNIDLITAICYLYY